jgi:hypothetical protein
MVFPTELQARFGNETKKKLLTERNLTPSQRLNLRNLQNPTHPKHRDTQDLVHPSTDIQMVDHILTCQSDVLHNPFRTILRLRCCSSFSLLLLLRSILALRSSSPPLLPRLPSLRLPPCPVRTVSTGSQEPPSHTIPSPSTFPSTSS